MVYIETTSRDGSAIYFDAHTAERCDQGIRVSGMIGDGGYEGEVLVECGQVAEVTFADAWLGDFEYQQFAARCDLGRLKQALIDTVGKMSLQSARRDSSHRQTTQRLVSRVAERQPLWKVVA